MPWHDPRCPKCGVGKGRKIDKTASRPDKWVFKCSYGECGYEFEDWKHDLRKR